MPEYSIKDIFDMVNVGSLPSFPEEPKYAELSPDEVKAIHDRLLAISENEEIFSALWEARNKIYEAVRMVKKRTHTDFKGSNAEGDDLDMHFIDPKDVKKSGTPLNTFNQNVTAGTAYYWSDTGDNKVELNEDEAIVIVGWYDPVASPKADKVLFELPKRNYLADLPFRMAKDVPIVIHEPIVLGPKDKFRIKVHYESDGTDALMPIGVKISKAENFTI